MQSTIVTLGTAKLNGINPQRPPATVIHIGTVALAQAMLDAGQLVELPVTPQVKSTAQLAMVRLARRTEAPAMTAFRGFVGDMLGDTTRRVG